MLELKTAICQNFNLNPKDHKLYRTDWLDEPVEHISKENLNLTNALIRTGNLLIVKDNASVI